MKSWMKLVVERAEVATIAAVAVMAAPYANAVPKATMVPVVTNSASDVSAAAQGQIAEKLLKLASENAVEKHARRAKPFARVRPGPIWAQWKGQVHSQFDNSHVGPNGDVFLAYQSN